MAPALTPLRYDRRPDLDSLERLVDLQVRAGASGMLVVGSSGESVSLSADDRLQVIEHAIAYAAGRLHIMAGISTYGLEDAMREVQAVAALHPDSILVAAPAGLQLSPGELIDHFGALSEVAEAPLVAYDVPARVGTSLGVDTIATLASAGIIAGVKDSSTDLTKARLITQATADRGDFVRYTGCEYNIDASLLMGYHGAVPGLANVFPDFHVELARCAAEADWAGAAKVQGAITELLSLYDAPLAGGSGSAAFYAATKEALRQKGIFATNASSRPQTQSDESVSRYVTDVMKRADRLSEDLSIRKP